MNSYRKQTIWQGLNLLFFTVMVLVVAPTYVGAAVRFIVVGDTRGSSDEKPINTEKLNEIVLATIAEKADFIVVTGDLVHGYTSPENLRSQLIAWRQIMQDLKNAGIGVYPCRGNHDLNAIGEHDAQVKQVWDEVFADYNLPENGPSPPDYPEDETYITYSFNEENVLIVALDTYVSPHRINQKWLDDQFDENGQEHVFVFAHEPAFSVKPRDVLDKFPDKRNAFWNSIACEGGRIYFAGHDHFYNHARIDDGDGYPNNDLHQFVVGTAGAPLNSWDGKYEGDNDPWEPQLVYHEEEFGYVVVDIDGQNVTAAWKHRTNTGSYVYGDDIFSYNSVTTVCFQNDVSPSANYKGTRDTTLSEANPSSNLGNEINLYVDGDDPNGSGKDLSALIKWDIGTIPLHAHILGACITSNVSNKTTNTYMLYEIMEYWNEYEVTWNLRPNRGEKVLGYFSPGETGTYKICLNDDGLDLVQSWVDNSSENHGLIIDNSSATDGADFDSREALPVRNRPKLSIRYPPLFIDVPIGYWAEKHIYKIYEAGITQGCSKKPLKYCPQDDVTRAQMAIFLGRGIHGSNYKPPPAKGIFKDVPVGHWAAAWIEQFYKDGITTGCKKNPLMYCPGADVTRAQMAIFLLRSKYGKGYKPPKATGIFTDVPVTYWAAAWIEQLYKEGITTGCQKKPLRYCPDSSATRAQMAVFIVKTFGL